MYHNLPVLDVHGHLSVPFGANSFLMLMMGSNTPVESPVGQDFAGPARVSVQDFREAAAVRPETGRTSDDLVPMIEAFDFLSEADKMQIFRDNPARVIPALGKIR